MYSVFSSAYFVYIQMYVQLRTGVELLAQDGCKCLTSILTYIHCTYDDCPLSHYRY